MEHRFKLCDELLGRLRLLQANDDAEVRVNTLPLMSIFWSDEWPGGDLPHVRCHKKCGESLYRLVAARAEFWRSGNIPADSQALWDQAKELIPNWPGFQRMHITKEQRRLIEKCERQVKELVTAMRKSELFDRGIE
jgi:hypothetical protein